MPERVPIAARLLFVAAESTLRREVCLSDPLVGRVYEDFDFRMTAQWTFTPSLALSRGGFRAWSPGSETGQESLAIRLNSALEHNVGHLGQLNAWLQEIEGFSGKNKKSNRRKLMDLFLQSPIMSADHAASALKITSRATRSLIDEAADKKLITLITPRRSYRLWAVPVLAKMLREKPVTMQHRKYSAVSKREDAPSEAAKDTRFSREENQEAISAATRELDDAIAKADRILAKYNLQSE